jgi:c-di-GMP-related signal transduction protein
MEEIVGPMPLDQEIKKALFGEQNRAHAWLDLVESVHQGSWEKAGELLEDFGVDTEHASTLHARATAWTHSILRGAAQKVPPPKADQAKEKPA